MKEQIGQLNQKRAHLMIDQLYHLGVRYFCLAPGSRSTSLAIALAEHEKASSFIHFDERGLGFHALGYAKASKSPVAIIVTSGTAVANLFPAIMEASLDRVPLLLLTADRPTELRDCGANQTADQVKIFSPYVRWEADLPLSDPLLSDSFLSSTLAQAVYQASYSPMGPVHLNCMIREPFFVSEPLSHSSIQPCIYEPKASTCLASSLEKWAHLFSSFKKGIILIGSNCSIAKKASIETLAEITGWPIFTDILSGARSLGDIPAHVEYYDLILKAQPDLEVEAVLHFGDRFVSKTLSEWLIRQPRLTYFQVTDHPMRQDPLHLVNYRMECSVDHFCEAIVPFLTSQKEEWMQSWKLRSEQIRSLLSLYFTQKAEMSEPSIFQTFSEERLPFSLFISNSMPIRDADLFFFPESSSAKIYANRGVSGIDGNIATAVGIASSLQTPLIAVLGDLAFLHDLNSLAQWKKCSSPIIFLVINNQGGGIFSFLPIANKTPFFEEFFATAHPFSFSAIAEAFSLPYYSLKEKTEWHTLWAQMKESPTSCLIEIKTDRNDNVKYHREIYHQVQELLCSPTNALVLSISDA